MTIAQKYNAKCKQLLPVFYQMMKVDDQIQTSTDIDEIVFRRSEYLGGMAHVVLELIKEDGNE